MHVHMHACLHVLTVYVELQTRLKKTYVKTGLKAGKLLPNFLEL